MSGNRLALLIGVSQYGTGYDPLPGTHRDVAEVQRVLQDPNLGAFQVQNPLLDPDSSTIGSTIRQFITSGQRDDLLLIYFTGHGALSDVNHQLYLASCNTCKVSDQLDENTAFPTDTLRQYLVNKRICKARRVIVVLDCCYSGAVLNWLKKGDDNKFAGFRSQGKVLLAACSAIESAYQPTEMDDPNQPPMSIYTRYLVRGIEQGVAQHYNDEWISVQALHDYISRSIQTESPAEMHPQIIALEDSYNLPIARAPKGDPKLIYRQKVEEIVQDTEGEIDELLDRPTLEEKRNALNLDSETTHAIEQQVQAPYRILAEKRRKYANFWRNLLQSGRDLQTRRVQAAIQRFRGELRLEPGHFAQIEAQVQQALDIHNPTPQPPITTPPPLVSEQGVDYTKLRNLLAQAAQTNDPKTWQAADQETLKVMEQALGKDWQSWETPDLQNFPCADLNTIDQLWQHHSNGHFGFSVQQEIYLACGAQPNGQYPGDDIWHRFCTQVGWQVNNAYISYAEVNFSRAAQRGHLPLNFFALVGGSFRFAFLFGVVFSSLASQLANCRQPSSQPSLGPPQTPASPAPTAPRQPKSSPTQPPPPQLASEKGVDYTQLRDLLAQAAQTNDPETWKAADQETLKVMEQALDGKKWTAWTSKDLLNFPCQDLRTIDQLWVHYSRGQFGFSVQKEIYAGCGAKLDGEYPGDKIWRSFCTQVGWHMNNSYTSYSEVTFNTSAKQGHLPFFCLVWGGPGGMARYLGYGSVSLLSHRDL